MHLPLLREVEHPVLWPEAGASSSSCPGAASSEEAGTKWLLLHMALGELVVDRTQPASLDFTSSATPARWQRSATLCQLCRFLRWILTEPTTCARGVR